MGATTALASVVRKPNSSCLPSMGALLGPRTPRREARRLAKAKRGLSSARANQVGVLRGLVSAYSQNDVAGTMQRFRLPSHPRQCGLFDVANVGYGRATVLRRSRHAPAGHDKLSLFPRNLPRQDGADRPHRRGRRALAFGQAVEVAHGRQLCSQPAPGGRAIMGENDGAGRTTPIPQSYFMAAIGRQGNEDEIAVHTPLARHADFSDRGESFSAVPSAGARAGATGSHVVAAPFEQRRVFSITS